jgi:hypothetical protein
MPAAAEAADERPLSANHLYLAQQRRIDDIFIVLASPARPKLPLRNEHATELEGRRETV